MVTALCMNRDVRKDAIVSLSFSPSLSVVCYTGDKERRAELQRELLDDGHFHVLLTTYEVRLECLRNLQFR